MGGSREGEEEGKEDCARKGWKACGRKNEWIVEGKRKVETDV